MPTSSSAIGGGESATLITFSSILSDMYNSSIGSSFGGQPNNNLMPNMALNYIICVNGIYPTFA